jgi:hypothetical protein
MVKSAPLEPDQHTALAELVNASKAQFRGTVDGVRRIINDLYTGRDPASGGADLPPGGIPWNQIIDPDKTTTWTYPQVGVNLMQSRTRQLITELIPAVPVFHSEPLVAEASALTEDQNTISSWGARHGGLKKTFRKSTLHGLFGPHFGIKVVADKSHPHIEKRIQTIPIPASHCGYEPHHRRFSWHTYQTAWEHLQPSHREVLLKNLKDEPKPWEIATVTEVYHDKILHSEKSGCSVSWFIETNATETPAIPQPWDSTVDNSTPLGAYVTTGTLPICPLVIEQFLDPAPGEDVPPAEVASWVSVLRSIHADVKQIEEEVGSINNIILVDKKAVDSEARAAIQNNPSGVTLYVPVDCSEDGMERANGVSHKMRPIERNSALGEIISALQTHLQLLDEVIGASSLDRGVAAQPRKSAAEASALASAGNRRTRDRLNVIADAMAQVALVTFHLQRTAYGSTLKIPIANYLVKTLQVPDPKVARMAFRVDAVELGNLSKQGQVETHAASVTLLTNVRQQAPELIQPQIIIREVQKYLRALGNYEAADAIRPPISASGPDQRIRDYMYGRTTEILVLEGDPHEEFLQFYLTEIETAAAKGGINVPATAIDAAIRRHQSFATAQAPSAPPQQPVPGFNPAGQPDNQALEAIEGGGIPLDQIQSLTQF